MAGVKYRRRHLHEGEVGAKPHETLFNHMREGSICRREVTVRVHTAAVHIVHIGAPAVARAQEAVPEAGQEAVIMDTVRVHTVL